jgi:hypothetical protein
MLIIRGVFFVAEDKSTTKTETLGLTQLQEKAFWTAGKVGIYKELHRKGLISDMRLGRLIEAQYK